MADSNFWQDYTQKFRAIRDNGMLRADWTQTAKAGEESLLAPVAWRLTGLDFSMRSTELEFVTLARRCGPEIYPYMDSLEGWLEELRSRQALNDHSRGTGVECNPDGTIAARTNFGSILAVCEASAFVCQLLESEALETERLERNRKEREAMTEKMDAQRAGSHSVLPSTQSGDLDLEEPHPVIKPMALASESAIDELRLFGLDIQISEDVAQNILGELEVITGRKQQGVYDTNRYQPLYDAYRAIALEIVTATTPDEVLDVMIPKVVDAYRLMYNWVSVVRTEDCRSLLSGAITEWRGRRRKMRPVVTYTDEDFVDPTPENLPSAGPKADETTTNDEPASLKNLYLEQFPEKIMILDICWAAKQHYREWTRWLGGDLKAGSKPDRAFRAILRSGKSPAEYRTEPRPKNWK